MPPVLIPVFPRDTISPSNLIPVYLLLEAVRELKAHNDRLMLDIEALKSRLERLEKMLNVE